MSDAKGTSCYSCGALVSGPEVGTARPSRTAVCDGCSAYLHCCRNCRFYDPGAYNNCREPVAEDVRDKEEANFCDYFEWGVEGEGDEKGEGRKNAKEKFEALFK